ncbi:hypothetical protein NONI108955_37595 [Nocardia ninae]|uniref:hypothetical protein n=1 Tax=Nocardia ninae TaxID=356145 RepID=UPI00164991AB|nr:hypothetical protein [Nocardia ninae]
MNSRIIRPIIVAGLMMSASVFGTGIANADSAAPISGSVEVCLPIPLGPLEFNLCL